MTQIMWRKLPYPKQYLLLFRPETYHIHITDLITIWYVQYSEEEFLNVLKESNNDLEVASDSQLLQLGCKMLAEPQNLKKVNFTFEDGIMTITMSMSCGFPFYLVMKLTEGSKEMFASGVTQSLLKIVHDLKTSENKLRALLIKKDKEIREYKNETDVRLARYLKTEVFHDDEHMSKHSVYESYFGALEESNCVEQIIHEIEDRVIVKPENAEVEPPTVKVEPDVQQVIKVEPDIPENEPQSPSNSQSVTVKREIKTEHEKISPKKKFKRLLL